MHQPVDLRKEVEIFGAMKIKAKGASKKKRRKNFDIEQIDERGTMRFPQLNKFLRNRSIHGFGPL